MSKVSLCALFAASVFAASAADLSEYVQTDLIAMWDGYLNQGADRPHDSTARMWYDTTGQYGFLLLDGAMTGDMCCKFSKRGGYYSYATLSADDTAATFERARGGTLEVVYSKIGYSNNPGDQEVVLQSSSASGMAVGGTSTQLYVSTATGSPVYNYSPFNRMNTVTVTYADGRPVAAFANGVELTDVAKSDYYGSPASETYLGNRANKAAGFTGYVFAIRLYARQLTPEEIAQNAAADRERYFNRKLGPSADYPMVDYMEGVEASRIFAVGDGLTVNAAHDAAVEYLAANPGETAAVVVPAGEHLLTTGIVMVAGEKIVGAGPDRTFLNARDIGLAVSGVASALTVSHADNLVRGIAITGLVEGQLSGGTGTGQRVYRVSAGVVDSCRSTFNRGTYGGNGVGFEITGGTVTNCLVDHTSLSNMQKSGLGASISGGLLVGSEICYTDSALGRSISGSGLCITGSGVVRNCRIHDCGKVRIYGGESGAGVYMNGGTLENSLVYNNLASNESLAPTVAAGVHVQNGKMRYCTIVNNMTVNDAVGRSGLVQANGDVRNCIIVDNCSAELGANVTGGTFVRNLLNKAVAGRDDNYTTLDAKFVDEGAADFHLAVKASPAVGKAVPVAGVETDFDGVARDPEKPAIGAYEYVAQAAEFTADVLVSQAQWREGGAPSVELVCDGVTDETKLSVAWYVDGAEVAACADQLLPSFAGLANGVHSVKAVATYDGQTKVSEVKDAFVVQPLRVYVNRTGTATFPYDTPGKGCPTVAAAYAALWKNADETTYVDIAAGEYELGDAINVECPVVFSGAGSDATTLVGFDTVTRLMTLNHAGASLSGVTLSGAVSGGGIELARGLVENCLITNCVAGGYDPVGAGVLVRSGTLRDSEIACCRCNSTYGYGGGVGLMGADGVVSNCFIHGCCVISSHSLQGGAVYLRHGLLTNCRVDDCGDHLRTSMPSTTGGAIAMYGHVSEAKPWGRLRNVLVTRCSSIGGPVVFVAAGTLESVTVAGNETAEGVAALRLAPENGNGNFFGVTVTNCVAWGNSSLDFEARQGTYSNTATQAVTTYDPKIGYCCWPTAEEGADGNTAGDPRLRRSRAGWCRLGAGSAAYGAGVPQEWMAEATDLDGLPMLKDGRVSMGCYQAAAPGFMISVFGERPVALFTSRPVTEKTDVPVALQSAEYRLSFDVAFPEGAVHGFRLYQYFPRTAAGGQTEVHTAFDLDSGIVRTLGSVASGYTGSPWFNGGYTETGVKANETRRVVVIAHAGCISYFVEYNGVLYRCKTDMMPVQFKVEAVRFDGLENQPFGARISNVRIESFNPSMLPQAMPGFTVAEAPRTFEIPAEGDRVRFRLLPGTYPVEINVRFADEGEAAPALKLASMTHSFSDVDGKTIRWEDAGLNLSGCGDEPVGGKTPPLALHTRTRIKNRYKGAQVPDILAEIERYGERAAEHVFDFDLRRRDGRWQLWIDGEYIRTIPVVGALARVELDVPQSAQLKVEAAEMPALDALAEPLPDKAPFAVADCRVNLGDYSIEHDGYRSRLPTERMPDCYLRRVPVGTYVGAKVRCRLGGDLAKNTKVTARLTRFGFDGDLNGTSPDSMTQQTKEIARVPGQDVYEVDFAFDPGQIQDMIWQYGFEALHFEVLGPAIRQQYFSATEGKPDEADPSDVIVLGAELVHAPAGLCVRNGSFGNLFYAETETPRLTAEVEARVAGDYHVAWTVRDIDGRTIETYADDVTLAAGGRASLPREFAVRTPGWYGVTTVLEGADGARCVTRQSSFVLQPPNARKALWDSPYFAWAPMGVRNASVREQWAPWEDVYRRFGIRKTTLRDDMGENFFPGYPMTRSPLGHLGVSTAETAEERTAFYEEKVRANLANFPHADVATVLHESTGGLTPVLETIGGTTAIDDAQKADDALWTMRATEIASVYRRLWPGMRLSLGNSGNSLGVSGVLWRGRIDPSLADYIGEESTGASTPPEETVAANFWTIREQARAFGYDRVQPCACYEWKSRPRRNFNSTRIQAAFGVRDALIAHAWRSPSITVGCTPEPATCYFGTSWGDGVFTRTPLMQPLPSAAANSTLTLVLDSCTFRRQVPTGSKSVHCLEFTRGDEYVYAFWTARGQLGATLATTAGRAVRTGLYGASEEISGETLGLTVSEEPCYLTMTAPIDAVTLAAGPRQYAFDTYPGMENARELVRFDDPDALQPTKAPGVLGAARGLLPVNVPGDLALSFAQDEEKGTVAELTLRTDKPVTSPLFKEYGFVALKTPVDIPTDAATLAIDVKGNSCGGKVYLTLVDAAGKTWATAGRGGDGYYDQPGQMTLDFDGWCRLSFILTDASPVKNHSVFDDTTQWRCTNAGADTPMTPPFKLTGFGVSLKRKTLNLTEMEDSSSLSVRFAGMATY